MRTELQSALRDALSAFEAFAGVSFSFSSVTFKAWPVRMPESEMGHTLASQTQKFWFESFVSPIFKKGDELIDSDGMRYSVSNRLQLNPTTGTFKFAVLPGRFVSLASSNITTESGAQITTESGAPIATG